jgi:uncharacterized membrane protein
VLISLVVLLLAIALYLTEKMWSVASASSHRTQDGTPKNRNHLAWKNDWKI